MNKIRVLHVTPSYAPATGGIEEFVRALCSYSSGTGFIEPHVCVCNDGYPDQLERETVDGTPVLRLRCRGRGPVRWVPDVSALKPAFDVIHLHDPHVGALTARFAFCRPARPVVLSTHGGFFHTRRFRALKRLHLATIAPRLLSGVSAVLASSEQDFLTFASMSGCVHRVDNGIDFARFHGAYMETMDESRDCLYVGRLASNKRLDRLIDAFAALRHLSHDRALLRIAGEDVHGMREDLRARAQACGIGDRVVFSGCVRADELPVLFARCPFFVSASEYEGFGLAVVEAMATGAIPLVSDIDAFRAFVRDGVNGVLVDYRDPRAAARRIWETLTLPPARLNRMRHEAVRTARSYSWSNRVHQFLTVYRDLLGHRDADAAQSSRDVYSRA